MSKFLPLSMFLCIEFLIYLIVIVKLNPSHHEQIREIFVWVEFELERLGLELLGILLNKNQSDN